MKKIYHLASCSTCKRILSEIDHSGFEMQDIKTEAITTKQIEEMAKLSGSYLSLFSKRAMKYKEMGLKDKTLTELDYKKFLLEHYTFLKRPVFLLDDQIFVGNSKKVIEQLKTALVALD